MKHVHAIAASALLVLVTLGVAVWLYPELPAMTATHWNAQGVADGWTPKFWAAAIPVLVELGIAVLVPVLPRISPRRFGIEPFAQTYRLLMLVLQALLLVILVAALLAGAGRRVPIPLVVTVSVGALLVVFGNYMGKLRKNFFIGIKSPWTLASDAVWQRTHRLAGWLFVLAGVVWIAAGLAGLAPGWPVGAAVAAAVIPWVGSYFIYRRVEGRA